MLLIYLSCGWITGIPLGTKLSIHPLWLLISLLPLPFIFFFRQRNKLFITIALLILAVLGGIVRYQSSLPRPSPQDGCLWHTSTWRFRSRYQLMNPSSLITD